MGPSRSSANDCEVSASVHPSRRHSPLRGPAARHRATTPTRGVPGRHRAPFALVVALTSVLLLALAACGPAGSRASTAPVDSAASRHSAATSSALPAPQARTGAPSAPASPSAPAGTSSSPGGAAPSTEPTQPRPGGDEPPRGPVASVPTTIAADCSGDVTKALNAWMASVSDGSTLQFGVGGCYRVDGTLALRDRHDLTLDGRGAGFASSVVPPASPKIVRQMWFVLGGSGITIRNMTLRGTNPTAHFDVGREWFPLIGIAGTRDVLVDRVQGSHSWGDFVSIGPDVRRVTNSNGTRAVLPENVTIRDSSASVIGRHGVSCSGCKAVTVDHDVFRDVAYQVVDIEVEASTWYARDVAVTNNTIAGRVHLSVLANAGIGSDVTNITVSGNTMTGTPISCASPIQVDDTEPVKSNFVISNNRFTTLGNAFRLKGVSGVTAEGNAITFRNGGCTDPGVAVVTANIQGGVVRNNNFAGATRLLQEGATATGTVCGNRLAGPAFDQPRPCDAP